MKVDSPTLLSSNCFPSRHVLSNTIFAQVIDQEILHKALEVCVLSYHMPRSLLIIQPEHLTWMEALGPEPSELMKIDSNQVGKNCPIVKLKT